MRHSLKAEKSFIQSSERKNFSRSEKVVHTATLLTFAFKSERCLNKVFKVVPIDKNLKRTNRLRVVKTLRKPILLFES